AYPKDKSIVDLFEEQAASTPENIAVVFEEKEFTYRELNKRANQLASYLRSRGVQEETLVPICIERSLEMIAGILGTLKAGGAYVPIDPEYPEDRIAYMLEDTAASVIVSSKAASSKLAGLTGAAIIELDNSWEEIAKEPAVNPKNKITPDNLAYVIYTSGSTGKPKGAMNEHRGILNRLSWAKKYYNVTESDIILQKTTFSFDVSVWELLLPLIVGAKLVFAKPHEQKNNEYLKWIIEQKKITMLHFVPSMLSVFLDDFKLGECKTVKKLLCSGEALTSSLVNEFKKKFDDADLHNLYGPTEAAIDVSYWSLPKAKDKVKVVPIGKPVDNTQLYILSESYDLVPIGIAGEICIGGVQVGRGYLNREELTSEKFVKNPFTKEANSRMYKTGDLGRWLPDGNIEYLGRRDNQVKIRGFRIELGEIESVLLQSGLVKQAVVLALKDKEGNKRLVGYIVSNEIFNKELVTAFLHKKLPEYMVPALWVELESLPLTSNGKVDKKALPEPNVSEIINNEYAAPRNELESNLINIWKGLLHVEAIGIYDNFFDIGGHSLLVMRLVSAIRRELKIDPMINDIFIYPTVAAFAQNYIEKIKNPSLPIINLKYLVPLKKGRNKTPLYIICGEGGTALRFKQFAELMDKDQPVYAIQAPIDAKIIKEFPTNIEDIAHEFIEEILTSNPGGPYALSGHCLGGFIALEMARQLKERGKVVHLLAMFDTIMGKIDKRKPASIKNFYNLPITVVKVISKIFLKFNFEFFLVRKHTRHAIRYKMNSFKYFIYKIKNRRKINANDLEYIGLSVFDKQSIYSNAFKNYNLRPFNGEIVLFYAKERNFFTDANNDIRFKKLHLSNHVKNRWNSYANNIKIHEIEGDHSTIFETTHAKEFAKILQAYLISDMELIAIDNNSNEQF
ncbi:MAG: amino acid adenylation domain-containing protein, partial [Bacteroidota bacterium]|nr:amino acid adenylation domain-containing protein [Bacteroidota bacterium]